MLIKMEVKLEKDIIFGWVTIPCIDGLGSCTYDNVCDMIHADQCPPEFIAHDIPCKCPFPKVILIYLLFSIYGSVHGKVNLKNSRNEIVFDR